MARDIHTLDMWAAPVARPVLVRYEPKVGPEHDGLRHYQLGAYEAIHRSFERHRSTMLVLATALGKTRTFASVAKHWPGRVLVLAHRGELVDQARATLEELTGEMVEIEQGQLKSYRARIVVASVQSCRPDRLARMEKLGGFSLVIADEFHHYTATTYRRALDYFKDAKVLGVTATPDRGDGKKLAQICDDVAYVMGIHEGVQDGYLVPPKGREVKVEEVNLDAVSVNAGDLAAGELDDAMLKGVEGVVRGMLHHSGEKQGVIFFPGVKSAHLAAARLNAIKPGCAVSLDGETDPDIRKQVVQDFKAGWIQFLCNCQIATEGFDAPSVAVVGLARPTKSRALYAQMVGRVTRVLPGTVDHIHGADGAAERRAAIAASKKPNCLLIDFTGKNTRHSLMTPEDLLGTDVEDDVKEKARELREKDENADKTVSELLTMSKLELERIAKAVRSKVRSTSREFDPFAHMGLDRSEPTKMELKYGHRPASEADRRFLERNGFKPHELDGISRRDAARMRDTLIKRREAKLATRNQLAVLAKHGAAHPDVTFEAASRGIDYLANNGWGKSAKPDVLHEILGTGNTTDW